MQNNDDSIKYPRRVFVRRSLTTLGRALLSLLSKVEVIGKEKLPNKGPIILAGNHVAVLEAVMMAVYTPGIVEFIGNGDIPFDPNYAFITNAYGLIPVNRGNLDRKGLHMGLDVLKQEGILGIFPEGGIWDPAQMQAQIGAAWFSYRAQAPILPIGFGGIKGGLQKAFSLQRPRLVMNVGEIIPPVTLIADESSLKANLAYAANRIMAEINALIPEEDLEALRRHVDETFELQIKVHSRESSLPLPDDFQVQHGSAYARFLYNPTMMDVLARNLGLPIRPIKHVDKCFDLTPVLNAWKAILDYLAINPGYFTYRFGMEDGMAVKQALLELTKLGQWAHASNFALTLRPIRRYQNANTGAQVMERGGCFPKSM